MVSLVSQSGQKMANICTWIADSIEDMINAAAMSYARPGSECLVVSQDEEGKWSLKTYVLCPNRKDWALINEQTDATVIGPDGVDLNELVQQEVSKQVPKAINNTLADMSEDELNKIAEGAIITESEITNISGGNASTITNK